MTAVLLWLRGGLIELRKAWISVQRWVDAWWGYDVFIAHRRLDAAQYAGALHSRLGAEKISSFIDRVVYGPGDSLLIATERHVTKSTVFLLVGSPELLKPRLPVDWVEKEINTFLEAHSSDPKVILIDFGDVVADGLACRAPNRAPDSPILQQLAPFLRLPEPLDALGLPPSDEVLAAIRQKLDGRRRDRTRLWVFETASAVLALLLILSVALGVAAELARQQASAQAFGSGAYSYSDRDPTVALRLAQQALAAGSNTTAMAAALRAFNLGSWFYSDRIDGATDAALSANETQIAWIAGSRIHVRELSGGKERTWSSDATNISFSSAGGIIAWKGWSNPAHGAFAIWDASGAQRQAFAYDFLAATDCGRDTVILPAFADNSSSGREVRLHVIDTVSGAEKTLPLPGRATWNLSLQAACTEGGGVIAVVQQLSTTGAIIRQDDQALTFAVPRNYLAESPDVSMDAKHVVIFLRGDAKGVKDGVGIIDLTTADSAATLAVVPLEEVSTEDAGGIVRFLDDSRVIAASTDGWIRIVDVNTHAVTDLPSKQRAADAIAVNPATGDFAIARRSGSVTIHDKSGIPLGRLVGNSPSDGLNPAFARLLVSSTGNAIVTVSRDGARLWRRPQNPLVAPADQRPGHEVEAPAQFASLFATSVERPGASNPASCRNLDGSTVDRVIDDSGSTALCVTFNGRTELLPTGMTKEEFPAFLLKKVDGSHGVVVWDDSSHLRLFAIDPERVMAYANRSDEIWSPDPSWLAQLIK